VALASDSLDVCSNVDHSTFAQMYGPWPLVQCIPRPAWKLCPMATNLKKISCKIWKRPQLVAVYYNLSWMKSIIFLYQIKRADFLSNNINFI
jgi:hypothetical protein